MSKTKNLIVEKLINDEEGEWKEVRMRHLVPGDVFRMWRFDGTDWSLHEDKHERKEWTVSSEPYTHPEYGVWTVQVEEVGEE